MKNKHFATSSLNSHGFVDILVLILVVFGIGALGYYSWQNGLIKNRPTSPTLSPTPVMDSPEITNWKLYRDERNGIEFNYRPDLKIQDDYSLKLVSLTYTPREGENYETFFQTSISVKEAENLTPEQFALTKLCGDKPENSFWIDAYNSCKNDVKTNITDYKNNNVEGVSVKFNPYENTVLAIIFKNPQNDKLYVLTSSTETGGDGPTQMGLKTIDQILSSLKFLNSFEPLSKINFKVDLPNNWKSEMRDIDRSETLILTRNESDTQLSQSQTDIFPTIIYIGSCTVYSTGCNIGANGNGFRSEFDVTILGKNTKAEAATRYDNFDTKTLAETQFQVSIYDKYNYPTITGAYYSEKERLEILQILSTFKFID